MPPLPASLAPHVLLRLCSPPSVLPLAVSPHQCRSTLPFGPLRAPLKGKRGRQCSPLPLQPPLRSLPFVRTHCPACPSPFVEHPIFVCCPPITVKHWRAMPPACLPRPHVLWAAACNRARHHPCSEACEAQWVDWQKEHAARCAGGAGYKACNTRRYRRGGGCGRTRGRGPQRVTVYCMHAAQEAGQAESGDDDHTMPQASCCSITAGPCPFPAKHPVSQHTSRTHARMLRLCQAALQVCKCVDCSGGWLAEKEHGAVKASRAFFYTQFLDQLEA